jgi:hypothetical protein
MCFHNFERVDWKFRWCICPGQIVLDTLPLYRVAAIFPEQFQSFTDALKIVHLN